MTIRHLAILTLLALALAGCGPSATAPEPQPLPRSALRKFPYPYRAALTITSDVDSCSRQEYLETHQFLNTRQDTAKNTLGRPGAAMGAGVGLELGDSFFPYTDYDSGGWTFTYFKRKTAARTADADLIRTWVHAGYIDVMHSFADMRDPHGFTRQMALAAVDELKKAQMDVMVFVSHGGTVNANNIGKLWRGDLPGAPEYHTDRSVHPRGPIRFISDGVCTSTLGFGLLRPTRLRDGTPAYIFPRYFDVKDGWNVEHLHVQISPAHLDALTHGEESCIVANHLGLLKSGGNPLPIFGPENQAALRELDRRARAGEIFVTTAARLLWYDYVRRNLECTLTEDADARRTITIRAVNDPVYGTFLPTPEQLQGITLYTDRPEMTRVLLGATDVTARLTRNPLDHHGKRSLSFPWRPLPPLPEWTSDGTTRKSEDYAIKDFTYTFSVTNLDTVAFAPTLTYIGLHPFSIREVRIGTKKLTDIPDGNHIRLPLLQPGETLSDIRVFNAHAAPN